MWPDVAGRGDHGRWQLLRLPAGLPLCGRRSRCGGGHRVSAVLDALHRWTILALFAHAFLAVLAATKADNQNPDDDQLIPLTCNEIRRLCTGLCQPAEPPNPAPLVTMATPPPIRRPSLPLPPTSHRHPHDYEVSLED